MSETPRRCWTNLRVQATGEPPGLEQEEIEHLKALGYLGPRGQQRVEARPPPGEPPMNQLKRRTGIEPATSGLENRDSTGE